MDDVQDERFGMILPVELRLAPTTESGRGGPVGAGYRPLCIFRSPHGTADVVVGMCELLVPIGVTIAPGESAMVALGFAHEVVDTVRPLIAAYETFFVADGMRVVGVARPKIRDEDADRNS
jgi:hypothetical protein